MKYVILFALVAAACALPVPEGRYLTRDELQSKARDVEALVTLLDQMKRIALAPRDDGDWEDPDSDLRDIEAFLAIIDLLENEAFSYVEMEQFDNQERDIEYYLDILDHLKTWVLATGAEMEQLFVEEADKEAYLDVLSLIEDIENYVSDEARDREAFLRMLDELRKIALTTGGNWQELDNRELDDDIFQAVLNVLRVTEKYADKAENSIQF